MTVLLGSWTDKGGLDPALSGSLAALEGKHVFLFGTCGFGGSRAYYDRVLDRFQSALPEGAEVIGRFMCQGQMPPAVRERYVRMAEQDPKKFAPMIENSIPSLSESSSHSSSRASRSARQVSSASCAAMRAE